MTREQTELALAKIVQACYYGATRRTRVVWNLTQTGIKLDQANELVRVMLDARLLEDHHGYGWISATPFLVGILDNWDSLTQDIPWEDDRISHEANEANG